MRTVRFQVADMHCSACVMRLEGLEDELEGVERVEASYHRQQMEVTFDEARLPLEAITAAAAKMGYPIQLIE